MEPFCEHCGKCAFEGWAYGHWVIRKLYFYPRVGHVCDACRPRAKA